MESKLSVSTSHIKSHPLNNGGKTIFISSLTNCPTFSPENKEKILYTIGVVVEENIMTPVSNQGYDRTKEKKFPFSVKGEVAVKNTAFITL